VSLPVTISLAEVLTAHIRNKAAVEFSRGKYPVILLENRWFEPIRIPVDLLLPSHPDPDESTRITTMFDHIDKAVDDAIAALKTQIVDDDGRLRFWVDSLTVHEVPSAREFVGGFVAREFLSVQGPLEPPRS